MQVINHHEGNYTYDDTYSSSVMYGTVKLTEDEWKDAIKYLRSRYTRAKAQTNTSVRDGLSHVFDWTLRNHGDKKRLCIGVAATELLFKHYKLPRYKRQNYVFDRS